MYFVLSPAKNLNEKNDLPFDFSQHYTQPALMMHACELMGELKTLAPTDLSALMSISGKLGQLNAVRNQNWRWDTTQPFSTDHADIPAKAALYLFDGDVYTGLDAYQLENKQVAYLNSHLGILSGLYGLLLWLRGDPKEASRASTTKAACFSRGCSISSCSLWRTALCICRSCFGVEDFLEFLPVVAGKDA